MSYRLIHLEMPGKIFEIRSDMNSAEAYAENSELLYSGSRKRWERGSVNDRVNVSRHYQNEE